MSLSVRFSAVMAGLVLVGMAGCGQAPQPSAPAKKPPSQASQQWTNVSNGFIEDYLRAQPFFAALAGRHEFDGQLPDLSSHGIKREIARLHDARTQIGAVDPATLEPRERFDREYLLSVIDKDLFWIEKARFPFTNPYWYLGNLDPDLYVSRNYAPAEVRLKAYIKYARSIPKMVTDIQANLQGPLPKTYVELGIADIGGFADFYTKNAAAAFASVTNPDLQKQLADADTNAANAMGNLKNYLIGLRKTATDKFPLGKDLFAEMLKDTERVEIPIADIEAAGRADLARNTQALKDECATYLPKGTLAACVAKMSANKPKAGFIDAARAQLVELKKFVQDNNVVSIPSNDRPWWRKPRSTIAQTRLLSKRRGRTTRGCLRPTISRRPIPRGRKLSRRHISRAKLHCSTPPCTRCGRDTSCNSCIRMPMLPSSRPCGWDMHSRKAGRITPRR
jgi:Bacterial protein of unknown function (DUF885)